jgi:hypothetical protein
MRKYTLLVAAAMLLIGCSGGETDLSQAQDKSMRDKMTQGLSPEEVEKYFGKEAADKVRQGKAFQPGAPSSPNKQPQ